MASIFISHSSKDATICDAVGRHVQQLGHSPLFVHRHARESDFVGVLDWAEELGNRAGSYEIFIVMLSSAWQASKECVWEYMTASRSGRTILPLKLDSDAPIPEGLRANVIPFSREPTKEHWRALDQALTSVGADPDSFKPQPHRKPFPGLNAFERADAAVYFGRGGDIREVRELLRWMRRRNREKELSRLCLIIGPSGAGKSSLMRAGVLARLEREPHEWLSPDTVTPSGDLIAALTDALKKKTATGLSRPLIRKALAGRKPQDLMELVEAARERAGQPDATLLLSIDQMEEAFAPELIDETLALLQAHQEMEVALDKPMPLLIVGTLRSDSYARLCNRRDVAALSTEEHRVAPLPIEYLSEVITRPLEVWRQPVRDVRIEPAVVERMIADARRIGDGAEAGPGDILPLVAIALRQLWDDHAHTEWFAGLTEAHYEETEGLNAIINKQGSRALRRITRETGITEEEILDALIPAVATADAKGNRVRAWTPESDFDTRMQAALKVLCEERLLHTDNRLSSGEGATAETVYSVAHEVVLRQWAILAHALDEQADHLMLKARVCEEAAAWAQICRVQNPQDMRNHDDEHTTVNPSSYLLLEGERLAQARGFQCADNAPSEVNDYIAACVAKQKNRAETLADRERRLKQARQQYLAANARELSSCGEHLSAIRLALAAWPISDGEPIHGALPAALALAAGRSSLRRCLNGHTAAVTAVDISPDGRRIASASMDKTIVIWDVRTGSQVGRTMTGHKAGIEAVAWSPDGRRLASGSRDKTMMIWDPLACQAIGEPIIGHSDGINALAWSPDGRSIVSASSDATIRKWDMMTCQLAGKPMRGHHITCYAVAFSPNGRLLVSAGGSEGGKLILWDADSCEYVGRTEKGHDSLVSAVAWSPDGHQFISGSFDKTIMRWDAGTLDRLGEPMTGHADKIAAVCWSPDGGRIASASDDRKIILWSQENGKMLRDPIAGHTDGICDLQWCHDGSRLISGGLDHSIIIWNVRDDEKIDITDTDPDLMNDPITSIRWSPDGRYFLTAGDWLRLWDAKSGLQVSELEDEHISIMFDVSWSHDGCRIATAGSDSKIGMLDPWSDHSKCLVMDAHEGWVNAIDWSPDDRCVVSGGSDGKLIIWDAAEGRPLGKPMVDHVDAVKAVAWSPNGRWIISGSDDNTVILWDVSNRARMGKPMTDHNSSISEIVWSPDSRWAVSASKDGRLIKWILGSTEPEAQVMAGHIGWVRTVACSPDGHRLVSGGVDRFLKIWDTATRECLAEIMSGHTEPVQAVAWSPDGRQLVSIGEDDKLIRWKVNWERLMSGSDLALASARRRLQGAEQLGEAECRILRELDGKGPDPDMIPKRWGYCGPEDDPFGDPTEESH